MARYSATVIIEYGFEFDPEEEDIEEGTDLEEWALLHYDDFRQFYSPYSCKVEEVEEYDEPEDEDESDDEEDE